MEEGSGNRDSFFTYIRRIACGAGYSSAKRYFYCAAPKGPLTLEKINL